MLGPIPVSRFSENSEFVNREMGETLGFLFQKEKSLKLWVSYDGNILCEHNLLAGRFLQQPLSLALSLEPDTPFYFLIHSVRIKARIEAH